MEWYMLNIQVKHWYYWKHKKWIDSINKIFWSTIKQTQTVSLYQICFININFTNPPLCTQIYKTKFLHCIRRYSPVEVMVWRKDSIKFLFLVFLGYSGKTNLTLTQKDQLTILVNLSISHHKLQNCFTMLTRPEEKQHLQEVTDLVQETILKPACAWLSFPCHWVGKLLYYFCDDF